MVLVKVLSADNAELAVAEGAGEVVALLSFGYESVALGTHLNVLTHG